MLWCPSQKLFTGHMTLLLNKTNNFVAFRERALFNTGGHRKFNCTSNEDLRDEMEG